MGMLLNAVTLLRVSKVRLQRAAPIILHRSNFHLRRLQSEQWSAENRKKDLFS